MQNTPGNNYALVVKRECETCCLIEPVIETLASRLGSSLKVYVQDDPAFLASLGNQVDDTSLAFSFHNDIEVVPTLIRFDQEGEEERIFGWDRQQWRNFTTFSDLGENLPAFKPGCGSRSQDPGINDRLTLQYGRGITHSRNITVDDQDDPVEACFDRGWTDGLPVVPPTPLRVLQMLRGTDRDPAEILGHMPPDYAPCSIEKVAINAVMAGCRPEYFPVVLATIETALLDAFCLHGLLCTTYFSSPLVVVNGPVARRMGMNSGVNALGQGNRANATIGRALQLVVLNVGGGRPGGIDRATLGTPGKYTFCFAEDESDSKWPSLAMDRGFRRQDSVVSLFAGSGVQPVMDQQSRSPESLARSLAASLRTVSHTKIYMQTDALLVLSPEHRRVFQQGGFSKADVAEALQQALCTPGAELVRGANGIAEGIPAQFADKQVHKFRKDGLHILSAGGTAGLFSAIIPGWVASGERGSQLVSNKF